MIAGAAVLVLLGLGTVRRGDPDRGDGPLLGLRRRLRGGRGPADRRPPAVGRPRPEPAAEPRAATRAPAGRRAGRQRGGGRAGSRDVRAGTGGHGPAAGAAAAPPRRRTCPTRGSRRSRSPTCCSSSTSRTRCSSSTSTRVTTSRAARPRRPGDHPAAAGRGPQRRLHPVRGLLARTGHLAERRARAGTARAAPGRSAGAGQPEAGALRALDPGAVPGRLGVHRRRQDLAGPLRGVLLERLGQRPRRRSTTARSGR